MDRRGAHEPSASDAETAVISAQATGAPARPQALVAGASLARYVVLEEVGRGGMGRVSRAYDPKLQREVALKELRSAGLGTEGTARLVAEARAMARLSHANVVAVYDVERTADDRVVLVMEYVPGQTLRQWLAAAPRPWQEIVRSFVAAGHGLVAAHAASLLHRDFKPANVLVAHDGAIKVTDFGVAKGIGDLRPSGDLELGSSDGDAITEAGTVLGTPRYMAPEQHRGAALTPAADQYAFCVALWEALCGAPPFVGESMVPQKLVGPPRWPPSGVPAPIAAAIVRGLAADPEQRHPTMAALLLALAWDPAVRRRRWRAGLVGTTLLGVVAVSWQSWSTARAQRCSGAAALLGPAWDPERRDALRAAIEAVGAEYTADVWQRTEQALDGYAADWIAMHEEACVATSVRGEQSSAVLDLRMACLHRARLELEATTAALVTADAEVVSKAHALLDGLPPLDRCADIEALRAEVEPPRPADAEVVEHVRALLARAEAARRAGRYDEAQADVAVATDAAAPLQYRPIQTEVAYVTGSVAHQRGEYDAAEAAWRTALALAAASQQWSTLGDVATKLINVAGDRGQHDAALRYAELARGLAADDPLRQARVLGSTGAIHFAQGRQTEAEAAFREALALQEAVLDPTDVALAETHNNLGVVLIELARYDDALAEHRLALAIYEAELGPQHPDCAWALHNIAADLHRKGDYAASETHLWRALQLREAALGSEHRDTALTRNTLAATLLQLGQLEAAEQQLRTSLAAALTSLGPEHADVATIRGNLASVLRERGQQGEALEQVRLALAAQIAALGPQHPSVAASHGNLAVHLFGLGKYAEALAELQQSLEIREATLGADHPDVALTRSNLGGMLEAQGEYAAAEAEHRRALEIRVAKLGADHPDVAQSRGNLCVALRRRDQLTEAEAECRAALEIREARLGADHIETAHSRSLLSGVLTATGRREEAQAQAERAVTRLSGDDVPADRRAAARFALAQALWSDDRSDRARAHALAQRALEDFGKFEPAGGHNSRAVRTWLERHPR